MTSGEWRAIPGIDGYDVNRNGVIQRQRLCEIRNGKVIETRPGLVLKSRVDSGGYLETRIVQHGKVQYIKNHVAVALAYVDNPYNKKFVLHDDGDKLNNVPSNLIWVDWNPRNVYGKRGKQTKYPMKIPVKKIYRHAKRASDMYHVYFIGNEFGAVKIGVSKDIMKRLSTLQTGSSMELSLLRLLTFRGENADKKAYRCERVLHEEFQTHRICGEWFDAYVRREVERNFKKIEIAHGDYTWEEH